MQWIDADQLRSLLDFPYLVDGLHALHREPEHELDERLVVANGYARRDVQHHQPANSFRVGEGQAHGGLAAHAVADEVHPWQRVLVEKA